MEPYKLKLSFEEFQKKRKVNPNSSNEEIINQVLKENIYNLTDRDKDIYKNYVFTQLEMIQRVDRIRKKTREEENKDEQKIPDKEKMDKRKILKSIKEAGERDKIEEEILNGGITKENLANRKFTYEGINPRKFGFGPPK